MRSICTLLILFAPSLLAAGISYYNGTNPDFDFSFDIVGSHSVERRSKRVWIVKCCGKKSCQGPPRGQGNKTPKPRPSTDPGGGGGDKENSVTLPPSTDAPPVACATQNFAALRACCQIHPTIFDYMDIDIRTCTNKTSSNTDFAYYKSILTDYMLNQAVTMKNKLDLRRVPYAVRFMECFFNERSWLARKDSGELFSRAMIDEFIDNIDPSWDDLLTDSLTNCTKVIRALVPWPSIILPSNDNPTGKNVYQTYPLLVVQCMRKVMLSYCPSPNRPVMSPRCGELRTKFKSCDPFQQTSNPPGAALPGVNDEDNYEDDNNDFDNTNVTPNLNNPGGGVTNPGGGFNPGGEDIFGGGNNPGGNFGGGNNPGGNFGGGNNPGGNFGGGNNPGGNFGGGNNPGGNFGGGNNPGGIFGGGNNPGGNFGGVTNFPNGQPTAGNGGDEGDGDY